jgi:hypothetical protein
MRQVPGRWPGSSSWRLAIAAGGVVALVATGIAFGACFANQAMDGTTVAEETEEPTAPVPAADSTPTPAVTAEPSPGAAVPSPVPEATWGPLGCLNCPVKAADQLRVTAEDIQLGKDGKYFVPDRGDGCAYEQDTSTAWGLVLRAPGCEMFWVQVSVGGEVHGVIP